MLYIEHSLNLSLEDVMRSLLNLGGQSSQKISSWISVTPLLFPLEAEFASQSHTQMN